MKNFFGKLLGGKGGAKQVTEDLLLDLREGERVSREVWDQCRSAEDLEDILHEEISRETLAGLASKKPECVFSLVQLAVESIEEVLPKDELEDSDEISLANSVIVLTHILAAGPGGAVKEVPTTADAIPECTPVEVQYPLLRLLWEQKGPTPANGSGSDKTAQPMAERIIDCVMDVLFLEGFTIDQLEGRKAGEGEEGKELTDGIDAECLWYDHVGPAPQEDAGQDEPNDETRENRCLALQLLLAALCLGAPTVVLKEEEQDEAKESSKPQARGRTKEKETPEKLAEKAAEEAQQADVVSVQPLISDTRFLAYLQDPERNVKWRGELLFSLLGLALDYDPTGYGVPYAGLFSGAKEENFASLAMQVLGLLLQSGSSMDIAADMAVVMRKPQELLGADGADTTPQVCPDGNVFHSFLAKIASEREVEFIDNGIATLFGTVEEDRRSYLPGSTRLPCFLSELLVLVYHLTGCGAFVKGVCLSEKDGDASAPALADSVLQLALQGAPEHVKEDDAIYIGMATLMRLTAYREFCDKLNEEYDGDPPDDLPNFTGRYADLVALAALKVIGDKIGTAQVNRLHRSIVEVALSTLCNVSSFAEGLCMETCHRLFKLYERCGKAQVVKKGRNGISVWLPRILEIFQNIVQYQYGPNVDMIYGLMTRETMLRDLAAVCEEMGVEAEPAEEKDAADDGHESSEGKNGNAKKLPGVAATDAAATAAPFPAEWWAEVQARLRPVLILLDAIVPALTAEVEKHEVSNPNDAKKFLPRTALGLLPVPHAFQLRSIHGNLLQHRACERCLVACVAHGPSGLMWDQDSDEEEEDEQDEAKPSTSKGRSAAGERKQERSSPGKKGRGAADSSSKGHSRTRSTSRTRRAAARAEAEGAQPSSPSQPLPAPAAPAPAPVPAPAVPVPANSELQAQLQAAAASGIDISALMQALAAQQAAVAPAAPAGYPPAPTAPAAEPVASAPVAPATAAAAEPGPSIPDAPVAEVAAVAGEPVAAEAPVAIVAGDEGGI